MSSQNDNSLRFSSFFIVEPKPPHISLELIDKNTLKLSLSSPTQNRKLNYTYRCCSNYSHHCKVSKSCMDICLKLS